MKFLLALSNILLAGIFFLFAWFQRDETDLKIYSDPAFGNPALDSALWLLFYAMIGGAFLFLLKKRLPLWYFIVAFLACLAGMYSSGPGLWDNLFGDQSFTMTQVSMSSDDARVELTREFFGAVIALVGVGYQFWQTRRAKKSSSPAK